MNALFAIVSALALQQSPDAGVARLSIDQSPHNLFGPGGRSSSPDVDLCQLCHVPSPLVKATLPQPRWAAATLDRNTALDVRADPNGPPLALRWAGSTLRCLSCHDETVSSIGITFRPGSGSLQTDPIAAEARRSEGRGGPALQVPQEWGDRIMGNHPVSVPWPVNGGGYRGFNARGVLVDPRFWVDDPKARGLKLHADTSGFDALRGTSGIECSSCHDPHGTANSYFLRLPKERSELCLGCHRK